jgi:transposase
MQPDRETIQTLGHTDATRALIVGNSVYDPLLFSRHTVRFSRRQYLFLNAYRLGTSLAEAAARADMSIDQAERFLGRPRTRAWLDDRAKKDHIRYEWHESNKWWELGHEVLEGKRHLSKDQQVVYLEFGKRVCPEVKAVQDSRPTIQINIDPSAVQEAFRRQNAIEAELGKGETA